MANETKWTYAAAITLEASGASAANAAFVAADDAAISTANAYDYPYADFVLHVTGFAATLSTSGNPSIGLYRKDVDIGSTAFDMPSPSVTFKKNYVGSFFMPLGLASATTTCDALIDVPITRNCVFSLENNAGQSINAGWVLMAVPKTFVPGT